MINIMNILAFIIMIFILIYYIFNKKKIVQFTNNENDLALQNTNIIIDKIFDGNRLLIPTNFNTLNLYLNEKNYLNIIPIGSIMIYNNSLHIPKGWVICDGKYYKLSQFLKNDEKHIGYDKIPINEDINNWILTPNTIGKFILGYDNNKKIYDNGGSFKIEQEQLPYHVHSYNYLSVEIGIASAGTGLGKTKDMLRSSLFNRSTNNTDTFTYSQTEFIPNYFSLKYIMKV